MRHLFQEAFRAIRTHRRVYVILNLSFYGLVIFGAVWVVFFPEVQQFLLKRVRLSLNQGGLKAVADVYRNGQVFAAMGLTFVTNLFAGALASVTIPSLLVPLSGLLVGFFRALIWGLLLSPADPHLRWATIPHGVTLLLEGQGYVLAMLAAYAHGKAWVRPQSVGEQTHRGGYVHGLKSSLSIYLLVVLMLAIAAIYEALEVIYLAPLLVQR